MKKIVAFSLLLLLFPAVVNDGFSESAPEGAASVEDPANGPSFSFAPKSEAGIITTSRWRKPDEEVIPEYTLGPEDVFGVAVQRHPEFTGVIIIGKDGRVTFPVGAERTFRAVPEYRDLRPVGLTEEQLAEVIKQRLKKYLYEPEVTVSVVEYGSKKYYVVGEVARPGRYPMRGSSLDLQEVIFAAGLPTPYAALRRVRVIKPDREKPKFKRINLYALLYKGDLRQNVKVEPGDIVYVPSTVASKVNTMLSQIISPASSANALQRLYYEFDTEYYRTRYQYLDWYYRTQQKGWLP